MRCKKCNAELPNEAKFCLNCGEGVEKNNGVVNGDINHIVSENGEEKKVDKKIITKVNKKILISLILIAVLISTIFIYYKKVYLVNKEVKSIVNLIENKEYGEAVTVFNGFNNSDDANDKVVTEGVIDKLSKKIEDVTNEYISEKIEFGELNRVYIELNKIKQLSSQIRENRIKALVYKNSRESMTKANNYLDNKKYMLAIDEYKKVNEKDKKNYETAKKNIEICLKDMYEYYISKSDKLNEEGDFESAYNTAKSLEKYYPEDAILKEKLEACMKNIYDKTLVKAEEAYSQKRYEEAIKIIDDIKKKYFDDDVTLAEKIKEYNTAMENAIEEAKAKKEKRKNELLSRTSKKYDDMKEITKIVPKGYSTRYINVDSQINIEPQLIRTKDNILTALVILVGFEQDDWVFFERVIFNADGEIFEWDMNYGDRQTQVIGGGDIAEWTNKNSFYYNGLVEEMKKIAYAKKAKIRFSGNGYRDHIVTQTEKNNLKLFIELFELLDENI